jgi:hypothetical protein
MLLEGYLEKGASPDGRDYRPGVQAHRARPAYSYVSRIVFVESVVSIRITHCANLFKDLTIDSYLADTGYPNS